MKISSKFRRLISISVFALFLAACSATPTSTPLDSHTVSLPPNPPELQAIVMLVGANNMSHCEFKGDVAASSKINEETGEHPPFTERLISARDDLRAKTYHLGGNTVQIIRTTNTGRFVIPENKEVTMDGKAYFCGE